MISSRVLILLIILVVGIISQPMLGNNKERPEKKDSRKATIAVVTASAIAAATLACIIANQSCGKRILSFLKKKNDKAAKTVSAATEETPSASTAKHVNVQEEKTVDKTTDEGLSSKVKEDEELKKKYAVPSTEEIENVIASLGKQRHTPEFTDELMENIPALTHNPALADEINELVEAGNLQEIIWRLREEGIVDQADQLEKYLSETLATAEIISRQYIGVGQNNPQLVEFANGVRGVYKATSRREREVAMYRLDQLIGTNAFPVTVERTVDGKTGSMQLFIENAASASEIKKWRKTEGVDAEGPVASKEINTLRLLGHDWDRNANNYMYPTKGRAFAVDGENSFSEGSNHYVRWQDLWNYFSASHGKRIEEVPKDVFQKIETIYLPESIPGYLTNQDFRDRLRKITKEQADTIIAPIIETITDGNDEIRKSFNILMKLKMYNLKLEQLELGTHHFLDEIQDEYYEVISIFNKVYSHLSKEHIEYKLTFFTNSIHNHAIAISGLRQRILDYLNVIAIDDVTTSSPKVKRHHIPDDID